MKYDAVTSQVETAECGPSVLVDHLYYASVERDLSPRGRSGYQIYRASDPSLVDLEQEITERLSARDENFDVKQTFFLLPDSRFAIAKVTPDPAADALGRKGLRFGHVVVLTEWALNLLGGNPFKVLDNTAIWESAETAAPRTQLEAFKLDKVAVCVTVQREEEVFEPLTAPMQRLFLYALRATSLLNARRPVYLLGEEVEAADELRRIFPLLPTSLAKLCSFDTDPGRNMATDGMWLLAGKKRGSGLGNLPTCTLRDGVWLDPDWVEPDCLETHAVSLASSALFCRREAKAYLSGLTTSFESPSEVLRSRWFKEMFALLPQQGCYFVRSQVFGGRSLDDLGVSDTLICRVLAEVLPFENPWERLCSRLGEEITKLFLARNDPLPQSEQTHLRGLSEHYQWRLMFALLLIESGLAERGVHNLPLKDRAVALKYLAERNRSRVRRGGEISKDSIQLSLEIDFTRTNRSQIDAMFLMLGINLASLRFNMVHPTYPLGRFSESLFDGMVRALLQDPEERSVFD